MSENRFHLEALNVVVTRDPSLKPVEVIDDGEITDYGTYARSLLKRCPPLYRLARLPLVRRLFVPSTQDTDGLCHIYSGPHSLRMHLSRRVGLSDDYSFFVQGHEEEHVLDALMNPKTVTRTIKEIAAYRSVFIEEGSWNDEEYRADMGGLIALKQLLDRRDDSAKRKIQAFETSIGDWVGDFDCSIRFRFSDGPRIKEPFELTLH